MQRLPFVAPIIGLLSGQSSSAQVGQCSQNQIQTQIQKIQMQLFPIIGLLSGQLASAQAGQCSREKIRQSFHSAPFIDT